VVESDPRLDRYKRLIEIARQLASTLNLDELLNRIVHAAVDISGAQAASILLYDQAQEQLYFQATTDTEQDVMRTISVPVDASIAGWIVKNRQPVIISESQSDARLYTQVGEISNLPTKSLLGVPLITNNKVIGALEAVNKRSGAFSAEDQDLLTILGAQAAVAIENSRLFQQSDWIAELVHELRTPMTSLNAATHLLLRPELAEEQRTQIAELIQNEIARLSDLTSAFLDLARLESGRAQIIPTVFDLPGLITECVQLMAGQADEKGVHLKVAAPGSLPAFSADRDKIKQVLLNLLSNAIKYNAPGGQVSIRLAHKQKQLLITISDDGPGIPPESLPHLFDKFYRVPGAEEFASGSGLGLSICKRIVEAHQGHIQAYSSPGQGVTFEVLLPILKGQL
jgi:signal transduction histidine kinase